MQSIMKTSGRGAIHAQDSDTHNAVLAVKAATVCGIVGGAWVNPHKAVTCQTCIRIMAAQVSKGVPHYRSLLQAALDVEFIYTANDGEDGTSDKTRSEREPTTFNICERGVTLSIPYNDGTVDAYTILWHELERLKDMVTTSTGGIDKISIITEAGEYDGQ